MRTCYCWHALQVRCGGDATYPGWRLVGLTPRYGRDRNRWRVYTETCHQSMPVPQLYNHTVMRPHTVIPTQVGIQKERKARPHTVMPTKVGIQKGHEGAEGTALACILLLPQVGLVVRDDNRYRASIMPFWVLICAGMTGRGRK